MSLSSEGVGLPPRIVRGRSFRASFCVRLNRRDRVAPLLLYPIYPTSSAAEALNS